MIPGIFFNQNQQSSVMKKPNQIQDDELDLDLVTKAMNNSYIRQMSNSYEQNINDLLFIINAFALGHIESKHQQLTQRKWCIVELDQQQLDKIGPFSSILSCGGSVNADITDKPKTLKLYCLVINMDCKQLHFQSLQDTNKHLFINFDTIPVHVIQTQGHPFQKQLISLRVTDNIKLDMYISPATMPYPYCIKATQKQQKWESQRTKNALHALLKKSIAQSRGRQLQLSKVLKYQNQFTQRRFVTEQQFSKYCQTGDVLLFRDNHTMAKVQRVLTSSQFDHVGVVYKHQKYGICLFQSNSGLGVALAVWNQLVRHRWFQKIQTITWRKLQVHNKPADFDQLVTDFVKENLHKKFSLNAKKLLKRTSKVPHTQKTDYFCSELVGTLYKFLGLLDPEKSATQYWPKDFSDKGNLKMRNNASLDPERQIIFEDKLLKKVYPFYK